MPRGNTGGKKPEEMSDQELFEHLALDLKNNFEDFMLKYNNLCYARAMNLTHYHEENAKDVVQEAFIKAYKSLEVHIRLHSPIRNLRGWMLTVLYSAYINKYRKDGPLTETLTDLHSELFADDPSTVITRIEANERLLKAIERLTKIHKEMICLHCIEGLSISEIRSKFYPNTPMNTLKCRLRRAKEALRTILENDRDEEGE